MTTFHLAERDLQDAAESPALMPPSQAAHLHSCRLCQGRVATYQQLFTAAAHQPQPVFAFDLTTLVLRQLPRAKPAFPWVLIVVAALVLAVVVAFLAVFGGLLLPLFQSVSTGLGAGLVAVAGLLVAGQCVELLARHRRQMRLLAFS